MCVKIVAECKEDVLLETVAIQDTQDSQFSSDSVGTSIPLKLDQNEKKTKEVG